MWSLLFARDMARRKENARANSRFIAAIDTGSPGTRKVGSSHGLDGRAGIAASRSVIDPPLKRGAAHSGNGLGHQPNSTPDMHRRPPPRQPAGRRPRPRAMAGQGYAAQPPPASPSTITIRYGQRSTRQSAHGTSCPHASEPKRNPKRRRRANGGDDSQDCAA